MKRYIPLEGTFNFRDIGGFITADGRTVKAGVLFRSDALYKLSDHDIEKLTEMGIRTVVDFRSPAEGAAHPNRLPKGVRSIILAPHAELASQASSSHGDDKAKVEKMLERVQAAEGKAYFKNNLDAMEQQMRDFVTSESGIESYGAFLKLLLNPDAAPLIFHCKGGKDRTGWAAALILSALGVNRSDIIADYLKTADYNKERNLRRINEYRQYTDNEIVLNYLASLMQVKESYILAAFEETDRLGGIMAYINNVLQFGRQEVEKLRNMYLENE